jgi:crotonobetainyl-CoA:carnitine CoA-transferase CaiB-like acyl-CoA transferase
MTLPLSGIKVLEMAEHGFVPSCCAVLADWGADVIKVERLEGDPMRSIIKNNLVPSADGFDYLYELVNRNKRGVALDLGSSDGRAVFDKLVSWADVYVTNQLPRVRRKFRTEPEDLFAINPKLVIARGHGQGQRGVDAEAGGYDSVSFWSRGGVGHMLTPPGADHLTMQRPAQGDVPTGMFFAGGICAALLHAQRTGEGVLVDTSLLNGAVWTLGPDMAYASVAGAEAPRPDASVPREMSPLMGDYRTADNRFVMLGMIGDDRYWAPACRALGLDHLIDEYPDDATRRPAFIALKPVFAAAIASKTKAELDIALRAHDCIFSFPANPPEVLADPAVVDNGYAMAHPVHPTLKLSAAPAQFDNELPRIRRPAPSLGQHTREVMEQLGFDTPAIDAAFASGAAAD